MSVDEKEALLETNAISLPLWPQGAKHGGLNVVFARYQHSEPFSMQLFQEFTSLRVVTYSASIPMVVRMLNFFESVECVFGYEGILHHFGAVLAFQKEVANGLLVAVKGLDDAGRKCILDKVAEGRVRFFVVKDAIAHSKIYLLEGEGKRRVIVGSANLSDRAFSGKQAETVLVFDDDEAAWEHYTGEYEAVRSNASSELSIPDLTQTEVALEDLPIVQQAKLSPDGVTVYVNTNAAAAAVPTIVRRVERLAEQYNHVAGAAAKPKSGRIQLTPKVVGTIVQLVKTHWTGGQETEEAPWLSIFIDTQKVLLSGKEIPLDPAVDAVESDVACLIEYFENFRKGFHGDVAHHQRNYFMFMSWFYLSPLVCTFRNQALVNDQFIFDFPMIAILFGKSNAGKSELIKTLMQSMFGEYRFVEKDSFTGQNLRALLASRKRFPVVFDDMDRNRFIRHGADVIKDETTMLDEYPPFVLSMNGESHSFSTEIVKRCLMLYTSASLPENEPASRALYRSVASIRKRLSTALYREYLRRVLSRLSSEELQPDMLRLSSEILVSVFAEHHGNLPDWCTPLSITDYQSKKYERVQDDLRKLYQTNRSIWGIRRDEVIIRPPQTEAAALRRDIPDWILRPGSKGGQLVLDRHYLEDFLEIRFGRSWMFWQ